METLQDTLNALDAKYQSPVYVNLVDIKKMAYMKISEITGEVDHSDIDMMTLSSSDHNMIEFLNTIMKRADSAKRFYLDEK